MEINHELLEFKLRLTRIKLELGESSLGSTCAPRCEGLEVLRRLIRLISVAVV